MTLQRASADARPALLSVGAILTALLLSACGGSTDPLASGAHGTSYNAAYNSWLSSYRAPEQVVVQGVGRGSLLASLNGPIVITPANGSFNPATSDPSVKLGARVSGVIVAVVHCSYPSTFSIYLGAGGWQGTYPAFPSAACTTPTDGYFTGQTEVTNANEGSVSVAGALVTKSLNRRVFADVSFYFVAHPLPGASVLAWAGN